MAEIKEQVVGAVEKALTEHAARIETVVAEVSKLQSKGFAQASAFLEDTSRIAREQMAFAEQVGGEWRKLVLASAKSATQLFGSVKI